jgi:hypothetical protein
MVTAGNGNSESAPAVLKSLDLFAAASLDSGFVRFQP